MLQLSNIYDLSLACTPDYKSSIRIFKHSFRHFMLLGSMLIVKLKPYPPFGNKTSLEDNGREHESRLPLISLEATTVW